MKRQVIIWPDEILSSSLNRRQFRAEYFDDARLVITRDIFFETPSPAASKPLPTADWALLSVLYNAMLYKRDIVIKGPISRRLAYNLEEFQGAFSLWREDLTSVQITAESEIEAGPPEANNQAVMTFSGGVDASFSAYRHIFKQPGTRHRDLKVAILAHGFDLALDNQSAFDIALRSSRKILDGTGVEVAVMRTNVRSILKNWEQAHGLALAACLHNFSQTFSHGIIAGDEPYTHLQFPWGSTALTNHLLSSEGFMVETDGTPYLRTTKVSHLANWEAAHSNIRVCWAGPKTGQNCGKCEKCIRTILNFRACGLGLPSAFAQDVSDDQITSINLKNDIQRDYLSDIYAVSKKRYPQENWVALIGGVIARYNATRAGGSTS